MSLRPSFQLLRDFQSHPRCAAATARGLRCSNGRPGELRDLNSKIVRESRELHNRHTAERGNAAQLSRPEPADVEERRKKQARDMDKRLRKRAGS